MLCFDADVALRAVEMGLELIHGARQVHNLREVKELRSQCTRILSTLPEDDPEVQENWKQLDSPGGLLCMWLGVCHFVCVQAQIKIRSPRMVRLCLSA